MSQPTPTTPEPTPPLSVLTTFAGHLAAVTRWGDRPCMYEITPARAVFARTRPTRIAASHPHAHTAGTAGYLHSGAPHE